jgi:hypothetical protein
MGKGLDNDGYGWHGVSIVTEIACLDFRKARRRRAGLPEEEDEAPDSALSLEEDLTAAVAELVADDQPKKPLWLKPDLLPSH